MNAQEIAAIIEDCLTSRAQVFTGAIVGQARVGDIVKVLLPHPIQGKGRVISAIALSDCFSSSCTLFLANTGVWYAIDDAPLNTVSVSNTTIRKQKQEQVLPTGVYPVKILFSIYEDNIVKFCIGGDRDKPLEIFSLPDTTFLHRLGISNTGKGKNDWIVGISYYENFLGGSGDVIVKTFYGADSNRNWELPANKNNQALDWKGYGFWSSANPHFPSFNIIKINDYNQNVEQIDTGDSVDRIKAILDSRSFQCVVSYPNASVPGGYYSSGSGDTPCKEYVAVTPLKGSGSRFKKNRILEVFNQGKYNVYNYTFETKLGQEIKRSFERTPRIAASLSYSESGCNPATIGSSFSGVEILPITTSYYNSNQFSNVSTQIVSFAASNGKLTSHIGTYKIEDTENLEENTLGYGEPIPPPNGSFGGHYTSGYKQLNWNISCVQFNTGFFFDHYEQQWVGHFEPIRSFQGYFKTDYLKRFETKMSVDIEIFPGVTKPYSDIQKSSESFSYTTDLIRITNSSSRQETLKRVRHHLYGHITSEDAALFDTGYSEEENQRLTTSQSKGYLRVKNTDFLIVDGAYYFNNFDSNLITNNLKEHQLAIVYTVDYFGGDFFKETEGRVDIYEFLPFGGGVKREKQPIPNSFKIKKLVHKNSHYGIYGISYYPPSN